MKEKNKKTGTLLTILLLLTGAGALFTIPQIVFYRTLSDQALSGLSQIEILKIINSLVVLLALYGIYRWKKWGIFVLGLSYISAIMRLLFAYRPANILLNLEESTYLWFIIINFLELIIVAIFWTLALYRQR